MSTKEKLRNQILTLGHKFQARGHWEAGESQLWDSLNREYKELTNKGQNMYDNDLLIGRDGGNLKQGPVNAERFGGENRASKLDLAISAWAKNQLGVPITGADVEACNQFGISAASNVFVVKFPVSMPTSGSALLARNSLSVRDGSSGAYTVPEAFMATLEQAMLYSSGILQACDVMRTDTGAAMPWPTTDDTSNEGSQIGENAESTVLDPSFGAVVFNSYKLTSRLVKVPHELLRDNNVNLARELGNMLGTRIGRVLNRKCTSGTGAGTAKGIVTAATLGKTAASATAIQFDELIDLMHSVDVAYRTSESGFGWMMHDSIAASIRKLKDGDGNYVWQQSVQLGQPDRLLGWPVTINNHMDSAAASTAKTVLCGAFKKYKVRLVAELRLRRLVERYAEFDQEGFLSFQEFDGNLLDAGTHPVKYLQH